MHEYAEILPAGTKLRMLGDRILLRPLDVHWSDRIIVARHGRPVRGEVVAIGRGHHTQKYKAGPKGPRSIVEYSRHFRPTEVRVGDVVELGGLNVFDGEGYQFPQVVIGTELFLIVTERDVAGVIVKACSDYRGDYANLDDDGCVNCGEPLLSHEVSNYLRPMVAGCGVQR